jgi:hypothetical protein
MKCQLCDAKATRIANLEKNPINWDGTKPDYARTGIIMCCAAHTKANTFNSLLTWGRLEEIEEAPKTSSVAKPTDKALRTIMSILRSTANPDNHYFINVDSGELMAHCYCDKNSFISGQPKNSYELCLGKRSSRSYKILNETIAPQWGMAEELDKMMRA